MIAERYGMNLKAIEYLNSLGDRHLGTVGQELIRPVLDEIPRVPSRKLRPLYGHDRNV